MKHISLLLAVGFFLVSRSSDGAAPVSSAAPGSPEFHASSQRPLGWRGDGTGRYPGATPPTAWSRERDKSAYKTKGVLWMTPMPNAGVSSPIVIGDRIYLTAEVSDLLCMDKQTGRILWIRSNSEFEGLTDEERGANPDFAGKLAPLLPLLEQANAEVVDALNAQLPTAATTTASAPKALAHKREIEKQILDQQLAIDKKRFERYWGQAVFGFSGPTPTSDGKHVCAFFTTGVSACYDLDGKRLWISRGAGAGSEHGNFASPLLCEGQLVVWAGEMRSYDVQTGKLLWRNPAKAFNTYGSLFRLQSGGEVVAAFQWGFFTRLRDGKPVWEQGVFGDSVATPLVEGDTILARGGYPKYNEKTEGLKAYKIPPRTDAGKLTPVRDYKVEWADDEVPIDKKKSPFNRGYVASPLFVDGLIYQLTQGGGLLVNDAETGEVVYHKVLPLKPKTEYWNWAGCGASPTLAGKNIYLMDNQGSTVVIQPGREYHVLAQNFLAEVNDHDEQVQNVSTPVFEESRLYYRTPGYLYCIGER